MCVCVCVFALGLAGFGLGLVYVCFGFRAEPVMGLRCVCVCVFALGLVGFCWVWVGFGVCLFWVPSRTYNGSLVCVCF